MLRAGQWGGWKRLLQAFRTEESEDPALPITHSRQVLERQGCPVHSAKMAGPGALQFQGQPLRQGLARLTGRLEGKSNSLLDISTPFISVKHHHSVVSGPENKLRHRAGKGRLSQAQAMGPGWAGPKLPEQTPDWTMAEERPLGTRGGRRGRRGFLLPAVHWRLTSRSRAGRRTGNPGGP